MLGAGLPTSEGLVAEGETEAKTHEFLGYPILLPLQNERVWHAEGFGWRGRACRAY